jgi:hypothetical protein
MAPAFFDWRAGSVLSLLAAVATTIALSLPGAVPAGRRAVLAIEREGRTPDCPAGAKRDVLSPDALECWFYEESAAWKIVTAVSAHGALVLETEVTDAAVLPAVARGVVRGSAGRFTEVLVYGMVLAPRDSLAADTGAGDVVTRVRWTPREGFTALMFRKPGQGRHLGPPSRQSRRD